MEFFKNNKGYKRVFEAIYAKYRSLGRLGGTITLTDLNSLEQQVLSNHLQRDLSRKSTVKFAVQEFADSLSLTKFADYSLEEILSIYFSTELTTTKEDAERFATRREEFFQGMIQANTGSIAANWLIAVKEQKAVGSRTIFQLYAKSPYRLKKQLETVAQALRLLEKRNVRFWRLPVFASLVTTDPHAFDLTSDLGKMLVNALCTVFGIAGPGSREEINEVFYGAGLLIDELSNFVTCAGLLAYQKKRVHSVWQSALEMREPLQVPLLNISTLTQVKSPLNVVYVVENPAVFTGILDAFPQGPLPPLICTSGQVKMAGLALLDLLAREQTTIYYSGDLDPEGMAIAQRLAKRYPGSLKYWRFTCHDYQRALSKRRLTDISLAKLNGINDQNLQPLAEMILVAKRAAYQELLLPDLISDLKKNCS